MTLESFLIIVAPLLLFIFGVLIIPYISKPKGEELIDPHKIISEFEKKYIY
tara:strand:+ start:160 stop:312 length:153 start_codon:yes stop_codon:yes gene_type:complete